LRVDELQTTVVGRHARVRLRVERCIERGALIDDFGESCQNFLGCQRATIRAGTCLAELTWNHGEWRGEALTCEDVTETTKSVAREIRRGAGG
jgi:hypothetical protein